MKVKPNSGPAIKGIASAIMWIGCISAILFFVILVFFQYELDVAFVTASIVFGVGCLISWLSTRLLYGFGELVQFTAETATYLEALTTAAQPGAVPANDEPDLDFQIQDHVLIKYTGSSDIAIIPYNTVAIGSYSFANCSHLTDVIIPETVKTIQDGAFFRCAGLTEIVLRPGVTSIDLCAFAECLNLTDVYIPKSVVQMSDFIFRDSPKITIHGYPGTCAEKYAKKNNIPFIAEVEE